MKRRGPGYGSCVLPGTSSGPLWDPWSGLDGPLACFSGGSSSYVTGDRWECCSSLCSEHSAVLLCAENLGSKHRASSSHGQPRKPPKAQWGKQAAPLKLSHWWDHRNYDSGKDNNSTFRMAEAMSSAIFGSSSVHLNRSQSLAAHPSPRSANSAD